MAKGGIDMSKWRGPEVAAKVAKAARNGIDEVMSDCVGDAKEDAPVATASYQGSIRIVEPAEQVGDEIAGIWGSTDINYALALETGDFSYLRGLAPEDTERVATRRNKGNRGSLRKSADKNYGNLPGAIARRMR